MIRRPPSLTRLRRHRGLWALALAVLLIKLAVGTFCLADAPLTASTPPAAALMQSVAAQPADANEAGCVLGEAGGCHCNCAHNLPLPSRGVMPLATLKTAFAAAPVSVGVMPARAASLLRPPIA